MEENVKVCITGTQEVLDGEAIEIVTTGHYLEKNGKIYLSYLDSVVDENNPVKTLIKSDGNLVSILRYGEQDSHLLFEKGVSHILPYETPFGSLEMISHTKEVDLKPFEGGFELKVDYHLELNRSSVGRNHLHVIATPLKK